jgi:CheY-like chemotaxis protein
MRALVADSAEGMLHYLCAILHTCGFECNTAADGIEALRTAFEHPVDLIVTDIGLRRLDGFELISLVNRGLVGLPAPAIIVCSANLHDRSFATRPELKLCAATVEKPLFPTHLFMALRRTFPLPDSLSATALSGGYSG